MTACSLHEALARPRHLGLRIALEQNVARLTDRDIALLLQALARHGALCLVAQRLTARQLHAFVARWGELIELTPGLALGTQEPGHPSITRIGNLRPDGSIIPNVQYAEYWHHDGDFWDSRQNFILNFLSSVTVPRHGGNTGLLDCRAAYARMPVTQKAALRGASICVRAAEISDFANAAPHEIPPEVHHAVLRPHPLTEEIALYLPDSRTGIEDEHGRCLGAVKPLVAQIEADVGKVEQVWAEGDLLILDNLQVMHRSMGGYGNSPRLLYRCQARLDVLSTSDIAGTGVR